MKRHQAFIVRTVFFGLGALAGAVGPAEEKQPASVTATEVAVSNVKPRRDVDGKILDAHDGCLKKYGDLYYLYGTSYGSSDGWGKENRMVCYSSPDLVRWTFHGDLIPGFKHQTAWTPKVLYNARSRQYVLVVSYGPLTGDPWQIGPYKGRAWQILAATADHPQGPYVIRTPALQLSQGPGVMGCPGVFLDDDGAGYIIYPKVADLGGPLKHAIAIDRLSDDFLTSTKQTSGVLADHCEGCLLFKRQGVYYAMFDYTSAFGPLGTGVRVYTARKPLGPYDYLGNINRKGGPRLPSDSKNDPIIKMQLNDVAEIPTDRGLQYVLLGDRWQTAPDGVKGHDFQYWTPLEFNSSGDILLLKWLDQWTIKLR